MRFASAFGLVRGKSPTAGRPEHASSSQSPCALAFNLLNCLTRAQVVAAFLEQRPQFGHSGLRSHGFLACRRGSVACRHGSVRQPTHFLVVEEILAACRAVPAQPVVADVDREPEFVAAHASVAVR